MGAASDIPDFDHNDLLGAVEHICGSEAADALCARLGGTSVYVPERPRPDSKLAEILGFEGLTRLVSEFGWGNFSIPLRNQKRRAAIILERTLAGVPINTIARELQCSVRHVSAVRASLRAAGKIGPARRGSSKPFPHAGQVASRTKEP